MAFSKPYKNDANKKVYDRIETMIYSRGSRLIVNIRSYEKEGDDLVPINSGTEYDIQFEFTSDFDPSELDKPNQNMIKQAYKWIKSNVEVYKEFQDE